MARYLILNNKKPIRFFHDVCDEYDGNREKRRSFCLQKGHAMVVPYRMYRNTKSAMAMKNILEVDAQEAIAYLEDCGASKKQIDKEILQEDRIEKTVLGNENSIQEDETHESSTMVSEYSEPNEAPRKIKRSRKAPDKITVE